jgi:hypothetical protein
MNTTRDSPSQPASARAGIAYRMLGSRTDEVIE